MQVILQCKPDYIPPESALRRALLSWHPLQEELVKTLCEAGADVNATYQGVTGIPLILATKQNNSVTLVNLLQKFGADVFQSGLEGKNAFSIVRQKNVALWKIACRSKVEQCLSDDHPKWQLLLKVISIPC